MDVSSAVFCGYNEQVSFFLADGFNLFKSPILNWPAPTGEAISKWQPLDPAGVQQLPEALREKGTSLPFSQGKFHHLQWGSFLGNNSHSFGMPPLGISHYHIHIKANSLFSSACGTHWLYGLFWFKKLLIFTEAWFTAPLNFNDQLWVSFWFDYK